MTVTLQKLTIEQDGIPGWVAHPNATGRHPAVLMLHHAPGLTGDYKLHAARLAQAGYAVFVPSLFNMLGFPGDNHFGMGAEIQEKRSDEQFLRSFGEAWEWLKARPYADAQRTAALGHCLGGRLGIPFAADNPELRALIAFYASVREEPVSELRPRHAFDTAKKVRCPTLMLYGGQDRVASNAVQRRLWQSFIEGGTPLEWHFFSAGLHGFAGVDSDGYNPDLGKVAWMLVDEFLQRHLMQAV